MSDERGLEPSSVQFDALIELLATDDARDDSNFHIAPEGTESTGLRDTSGKLDYAKIRSLFLQRRGNNDINHIPSSDLAPHHEPNSGITLPQVSYESYGDRTSTHTISSDCGGRTDGVDGKFLSFQDSARTKGCRVKGT